jgi:hypothetical protein
MNNSQTFCPEVSEELKPATISNLKKVNKLKQDSGLDWNQLAYLFDLDSQGIHSWASGESLSPENEEKLSQAVEVVEYISRGSASLNRRLLTEKIDNEVSCLDLLKKSAYDRVKELVGPGGMSSVTASNSMRSVSNKKHTLPNPADLIDALQDSIHYEVGEVRSAKDKRRQKV